MINDRMLPRFFGEWPLSLEGVMRFPNDPEKARIYTCWRLANMLAEVPGAAAHLSAVEMQEVLRGSNAFAQLLNETKRAEKAGSKVGAMVALLWHMLHTRPEIASWERVVQTMKRIDNRPRAGVDRSILYAEREKFGPVLCYWGARWLKDYREWSPQIRQQAEAMLVFFREWEEHESDTAKARKAAGEIRSPKPTSRIFHQPMFRPVFLTDEQEKVWPPVFELDPEMVAEPKKRGPVSSPK